VKHVCKRGSKRVGEQGLKKKVVVVVMVVVVVVVKEDSKYPSRTMS
jgi:hypothetical protein